MCMNFVYMYIRMFLFFFFTDFNEKIEKFADDNDPLGAFAYLLIHLSKLFEQKNFAELKQICLLRGVGF